MLQLNFTTNPNGKLFTEIFSDIRLQSQAYYAGLECEILYRDKFMGYAEIKAIRHFRFERLTDDDAFINCGFPAPYQAALLNRFYNGGRMLEPGTMLSRLTIGYITRNMELQNQLVEEWWKYKSQMAQ